MNIILMIAATLIIAIIGVVAGICAILLLVLLRFSKMIEEKTKQ